MNEVYGSMWRKWDLHVHTPKSILCDNYKIDESEKKKFLEYINENSYTDEVNMYYYIRELFNKAVENNIAAIGITDYFFIDGYRFIRETMQDTEKMRTIFKDELIQDNDYLEKIAKILLLPNVEFRTDVVISKKGTNQGKESKQSKLQVHVIFSDELDIDVIEQNFINALQFSTGESECPLNKINVERFGKEMKNRGVGGSGSDLLVGTNSIAVSLNDLRNLCDRKEFKGKTVIVLAEEDQSSIKWEGQAGSTRFKYYNMSDAIFTSNNKTIDWCLSKECEETVGKCLPFLWGSDAHDFEKIFVVDNDKFCWIKADVTFEGLVYALYRFNNRIHIGKVPIELENLKKREHFTIKTLQIVPNKKISGIKWFDSTVYFNPFMTTIIGNKGSGKSAVTDILGYLCNSEQMSAASFLNKDRFLNKKTKFGDDYKATLNFYNKDRESLEKEKLSLELKEQNVEYIKYLPQSYIEEVCNNVDDKFQEEINNTIFNFVNKNDKAGARNINELINLKTSTVTQNLRDLHQELRLINDTIIESEDKSTENYFNEINKELNIIKEQSINHNNQKPKEVAKPKEILESDNAKLFEILNTKKSNIKDKIAEHTDELTNINIQLQEIECFKMKINRIEGEIDKLNTEYSELADKLKLSPNTFANITIQNNEINDYEEVLKQNKQHINTLIYEDPFYNSSTLDNTKLNIEGVNNQLEKINNLNEKIRYIEAVTGLLEDRISREQQAYFSYQEELEKWKTTEKHYLERVEELESTVEYIKNELPKQLQENKERRRGIINRIIDKYFEKKDILREIYKPVQNIIESMDGLKNSNIVFKSYMRLEKDKLISEIINNIDLRKNSKFKENHFVENSVDSTDFEDADSIKQFIETIYSAATEKIDEIGSLIKDRNRFYYFIGSLEYIAPNFTINADGKSLKELSPGGRGIVLLIFYLTLSQGNIPLMIDQPEDNLDNQSVYSKLVPAILEAKKNRQIIIVTHNPNIAIACDSEAIIYCESGNDDKTLNYYTGSIEDEKMNKNILNVLEGTTPAFDIRKKSYNII